MRIKNLRGLRRIWPIAGEVCQRNTLKSTKERGRVGKIKQKEAKITKEFLTNSNLVSFAIFCRNYLSKAEIGRATETRLLPSSLAVTRCGFTFYLADPSPRLTSIAFAASYPILSASLSVLGLAAHATHFVMLPTLRGALATISYL